MTNITSNRIPLVLRRFCRGLGGLLLLLAVSSGPGCGGSGEGRLAELRALQDAGQFESTIEPLRSILDTNPEHAEARYRLGVALSRTGQPTMAVGHLERAARSPEYAVDSYLALARIHQATQSWEASIQAAEKALARDPENLDALALHAQSSLADNDHEQALEDAERILQLDPESFQGLALRAVLLEQLERYEEAEAAYEALAESNKEARVELSVRSCLGLAKFRAKFRDGGAEALEQIRKCIEPYKADLPILQTALSIYDELEKPDEALALLREAAEQEPASLPHQVALADRLAKTGQEKEAATILEQASEELQNPAAWSALANLRERTGDIEGALRALENALELVGGESEELQFRYAALLLRMSELDEAQRIAETLKEPAYRDVLLGRVHLERGEPAKALELLEESLRIWPNNAPARASAARAALELLDLDEASAQLREAARLDPNGSDASLHLARIELQRGELESAVLCARRHRTSRGFTGPGAHLIEARALHLQGRNDAARKVLANLEKIKGQELTAMREGVLLERQISGAEAAFGMLEKSEFDPTDPTQAGLLRMFVKLALEAGRADEAERAVARARAANPEVAEYLVIQASLMADLGDAAGARKALEQARELDPDGQEPLLALAELALDDENPDGAIALLKQVLEVDPSEATAGRLLARAYLLKGETAQAEQQLRAVLRKHPEGPDAANDLAWLLANEGRELDLALRLAASASRLAPEAQIFDTLGWVHYKRGEIDTAIATYEGLIKVWPRYPTARYHFGLALARKGDLDRAREMYEAALSAGDFPEAEAAKSELAALQSR